MSAAKHTPGPWIHEIGKDAPIGSVVDTVGNPIAQAQPNTSVRASDRLAQNVMRNANARLIAAAPDLLEALDAMMQGSEYKSLPGFGEEMCWASRQTPSHESLDKARIAIAKAKGEPA